jgi:hypothetical protein
MGLFLIQSYSSRLLKRSQSISSVRRPGYRLESRERHGSATLVFPAGKSTFLDCISFGIFQSFHTVQVGCTTAVYQLVAQRNQNSNSCRTRTRPGLNVLATVTCCIAARSASAALKSISNTRARLTHSAPPSPLPHTFRPNTNGFLWYCNASAFSRSTI